MTTINKITVNKGCRYESINIDEEDLLVSNTAKFKVFLHLYDIIDKLDSEEWKLILSMILENSSDFKEDIKESFHHTCNTCGDVNYFEVYTKKNKKE